MTTPRNRRSIRLPGYDYTQPGAYYITVVTFDRVHLFGEVMDGKLIPTPLAHIVRREWFKTAQLRPYITLNEDQFIIMPNHVHGIIWSNGIGHADLIPASDDQQNVEQFGRPVSASIPTIVRAFKSAVTYAARRDIHSWAGPIWQRNYYEHIIRDDADIARIQEYIATNPANWQDDQENPRNA